MSNYSEYKNRRKNIQETIQKMADVSGGSKDKKSYDDERLYQYKMDKAGNSVQKIRFLPNKNIDLPFVSLRYRHFFQIKGKYLIENCPSTLKKSCPICQKNSDIYNGSVTGPEEIKGRTRIKEYFANIQVVDDKQNPDNNGKNFIFKFGQEIYNMIMEKLKPDFGESIDVSDMEEGVDFVLKTYKKAGYVKYDKSYFEQTPSVVENPEDLFGKLYDISEFTNPSNFKSDAELIKRLQMVYGDSTIGVLQEKIETNKIDNEINQMNEQISEPESEEEDESEISSDDIDDLFD